MLVNEGAAIVPMANTFDCIKMSCIEIVYMEFIKVVITSVWEGSFNILLLMHSSKVESHSLCLILKYKDLINILTKIESHGIIWIYLNLIEMCNVSNILGFIFIENGCIFMYTMYIQWIQIISSFCGCKYMNVHFLRHLMYRASATATLK